MLVLAIESVAEREMNMLSRHRRVIGMTFCTALALLMAAALAAGCGGGSSTGEGLPKRELPENATPEKILLEATKATSEVTSFDFISETKFIVPPTGSEVSTSTMTMQSEGVYDNGTGNIQATLTIVELEMAPTEYIIYDEQYYMKNGDNWYEIEADSSFSPAAADITRETSEYLKNYQTISRLDDEVVNGRDCYHISMVPNLEVTLERSEIVDLVRQTASQQAGHELTDEEFEDKLEEVKSTLNNTGAVMEYWVDMESLVLRRTLTNIESQMQIEKSKSPITTKRLVEMDFVKYNVPTDISPPEVSMEWKGN